MIKGVKQEIFKKTYTTSLSNHTYIHKLENPDRMTRKFYLPNRSQETRDKKFKQTISRQKRKIIKELSFPKKPDPDDFTREFHQILRDQAILMLLTRSQERKRRKHSNAFCDSARGTAYREHLGQTSV